MRLPTDLTEEDVVESLAWIDKYPDDIPMSRRVKKFALIRDGKRYPPKFVISKAYGLKHGKDWPSDSFGGGPEANNFLLFHKFDIYEVLRKPYRRVMLEAVAEVSRHFVEGKKVSGWRTWKRREAKAGQVAKNQRLKDTGDLQCDVCGFSFQGVYGDLGLGFIEAHHKVPLKSFKAEKTIRVTDLALLCSNCHSMVHRTDPSTTVAELKAIVQASRKKE